MKIQHHDFRFLYDAARCICVLQVRDFLLVDGDQNHYTEWRNVPYVYPEPEPECEKRIVYRSYDKSLIKQKRFMSPSGQWLGWYDI